MSSTKPPQGSHARTPKDPSMPATSRHAGGRPSYKGSDYILAANTRLQMTLLKLTPELTAQLKNEMPNFSELVNTLEKLPLYVKVAQAKIDLRHAEQGI